MKYIKQISFCMVIAIFATGILTWNIFLNLETKSTVSVLSHSAIRFHILANSDSVSDQALKMRVKESVVNYIYEKTGDFKTVDEVKNFILNNDKTIKSIATKAIADNGYDYTVSSTFGFSDFPVKTYGDVIFPKGTYTSYTIKIGNGKGHNWWCVLYPPLCFVDVSTGVLPDNSKEKLRDSLSDTQYHTVTKYNFKFKYLKFFNNLCQN
ncbi:stage II sporulation protein R [Eubacterium ventriosum]|uniref:stage II sporulation protein R n=1 Tax=Eubacterium ventriosum TaxID=39496 RepID=UPI00241CFFB6|nr:stage II sporulation protein R [Eubacterium ventriosum]